MTSSARARPGTTVHGPEASGQRSGFQGPLQFWDILSAAMNENIYVPTGSDVVSNSLQRASRGLPNGFGYGIDPGTDGVPIAEVAFAGASGLHGHSIPTIELAVFQGAVEHGVVTLANLFAQLGELERLLLVIFHFGSERANAEEPCGNVG